MSERTVATHSAPGHEPPAPAAVRALLIEDEVEARWRARPEPRRP